jgi:hypothetical protein
MSTNAITNQDLSVSAEFRRLPNSSGAASRTTAKSYDGVPDALKTQDNWVGFRHEIKPDGKMQAHNVRVITMTVAIQSSESIPTLEPKPESEPRS